MAIDQALQEANDKLLKKRAELNQTGNRGLPIKNTDFEEIVDRCQKKQNVEFMSDYQEKTEEQNKKRCGFVEGIPKAYQKCTFENFTGNEKLIEDLKKLIETDKPGIILRGNTGCGKTHLAVAMSKLIPTQSRSVGAWDLILGAIFTTAPELLLKIRSSFQDGAKQTEEQLINYYSGTDLLILDDLGSEKTSEFAITTLYIILDRRIRECRQTIITTNLSREEIEQVFGARIASRLSLMENIKINMPDYRKRKN